MLRSLVLVIPLPSNLAVDFPAKDEDSSKPHITFIYQGDLDEKQWKAWLKTIADVVAFSGLENVVGSYAPLVTYFDTGTSRVAKMDVNFTGDLTALRNRIMMALRLAGFADDENFPVWQPHVTLGYLEPGGEWAGKVPGGEFDVKALEAWAVDSKGKSIVLARVPLASKGWMGRRD